MKESVLVEVQGQNGAYYKEYICFYIIIIEETFIIFFLVLYDSLFFLCNTKILVDSYF